MRLTQFSNGDRWSLQESFRGRYKNFKVTISSSGRGWSRNKDYYYFVVVSEKYNHTKNSLWLGESGEYKSASEAHDAVIEYIDKFVKELSE